MKSLFLFVLFSVPAMFAMPTTVATTQPDLTFRLSTIERRIEQMQIRLDSLERDFRGSSIRGSDRPEALADLKQQYLGLSEQVSLMQIQLVEARRAIDRLNAAEPRDDKTKEKNKEQPKTNEEKKKPGQSD